MGANSDLTRRAREDIEAVRAALRFGIRLRRDSRHSSAVRGIRARHGAPLLPVAHPDGLVYRTVTVPIAEPPRAP